MAQSNKEFLEIVQCLRRLNDQHRLTTTLTLTGTMTAAEVRAEVQRTKRDVDENLAVYGNAIIKYKTQGKTQKPVGSIGGRCWPKRTEKGVAVKKTPVKVTWRGWREGLKDVAAAVAFLAYFTYVCTGLFAWAPWVLGRRTYERAAHLHSLQFFSVLVGTLLLLPALWVVFCRNQKRSSSSSQSNPWYT